MRSFLNKKSITRTVLLGAVSMAFILPSSPAHAAQAAVGEADAPSGVSGVEWKTTGSCVGEAVSRDGSTMTVVVHGQSVAAGPAIDTAIACVIYAGGQRHELGGVGVGPAGAVVNAVTDLPLGPYRFCVELHTTYLNGIADKTCA
ncbi:MAG TPA: hypothetical protein VEU29_03580 [Actinomycetota bacterium]|nr:hypothetical protein [Actinomycetota bacterium]